MSEAAALDQARLLHGGRRRRQRERVVRFVLYLALLAAAAAVAGFTDWGRVATNFANPRLALAMFPEVLTIAAKHTLLWTVTSFAFGFVLALVLALMKLSPIGPYRWLATTYIEVFRGLPALLTLFIVGYGLPIALGVDIPYGDTGAVTLGLGLVAAAYMAEVFRAGIEAVPRGQVDAARSLGMSQGRATATIVLPQAFRIVIPPLTNELVLLIKDTSLAFILGTTPVTKELTKFSRDAMSDSLNSTPLVVAGLLYLVVTIPLTRAVALLERRTGRGR